ncbi:MAG: ABA4-like family protein [Pseudomonadota bacterium]
MDFETIFSIAGLIAVFGWLSLLVSPLVPRWSDWIAGMGLPIILSLGYVFLLIIPASGTAGGFGTLADVMELFSYEQAALAGWLHFLAFDLFIGAWVCRTARAESMSFWLVAPCLPVVFLFGPAGLLAFQVMRAIRGRTTRASTAA